MARKTDYETARGYLNKKTTEYAREILPEGISVRVLISGDIDKHVPPDKDRATIAAHCSGNSRLDEGGFDI